MTRLRHFVITNLIEDGQVWWHIVIAGTQQADVAAATPDARRIAKGRWKTREGAAVNASRLAGLVYALMELPDEAEVNRLRERDAMMRQWEKDARAAVEGLPR